MAFQDLLHVLLTSVFLTIVVCKPNRPRGVSLAKAPLYEFSPNFMCFDGSAQIEFHQINDDYCDCQDGSDEPGTSACPNGTFDCNNIGYRSKSIPSSQVNDGICDCCDGTDEYHSVKSCPNTCFELGKQLHEQVERVYKQQVDGHEMYKEYSRRGQERKTNLQQKVEFLKREKIDMETLRLHLDKLRADREAQEQQAKEQYLMIEKDVQDTEEFHRITKIFTELDANHDGFISNAELMQRKDFDGDGDGIVSVDEAQVYMHGNEVVDLKMFSDNIWNNVKHIFENQDFQLQTAEYDLHTRQLIAAAEQVRSEFEEVDNKCRALEVAISETEELLSVDFGAMLEFFSLHSECFNLSDADVLYVLCPFHKVTQLVDTEDAATVLGYWGQWIGEHDNKYKVMLYEHGDICDTDDNRSVKVNIQCGLISKILSVSKPSRCHHEIVFISPAACSQAPVRPDKDPLHDEL